MMLTVKNIGRMFAAMAMMAFAVVAQANAQQEVMSVVQDSTKMLVTKLQSEKQTYYENPQKFYGVMEGALQNLVDFERIAARVMGRYRREASDELKEKFVGVFKKSLFDAYGKALVESGEFKVNVLAATINPRDEGRASVDLEVISASGNKYPVIYSMYKNRNNKWLLENVIVNGVNIGLAFKDRFEQQVNVHNGDITKVVDSWSSRIEEGELTGEAK
ncbi:phospholipid-binding protein MlaC [Hahella sp. HN01]|uniref:MlaC/ttg2D family ABC transporter substrate-binding protein n=1 Tax=Hahella sp. HN01 TaxID=2847262 RepID=UPI001C1F12F9|nr:ABC transporter substrate-binding protein [Hahella sp. HN01]MBU6949986.1 ABC transporter substrate-binding protein [Hahella sp. HN01]